jgi:hypothetical protein
VFALASVPVVAAAAVAADVRFWVTIPFVLLAARATAWRDPSWRPARIGLVELGCLVAVLVAAALSV